MSKIQGDWFHSRSSSNIGELLAVRKLLIESQKLEYIGFSWSGGRHNNQKMYDFANAIGVQPSTMQTKIRTMIRYGFIKDNTTCPLQFTRIGQLWNDLYSIGNNKASQKLYQITLTISLAIYAFNDTQQGYSINPSKGELPLQYLFNNLINNKITIKDFQSLVDGNTTRTGLNTSYWKTDLVNAGLFVQQGTDLVYTNEFQEFINELKSFVPNPLLTDDDWQAIRENPLIEISPFKNSLKKIFLDISEMKELEDETQNQIITEPLIEFVAEEESVLIPEIDILSQGTRITQNYRRVRSSIWSRRVKQEHRFSCVVPNCDVVGNDFIVAAHIKPDAVAEENTPHRTHILNGLCLCNHCHIAFDKGFISLDDGYNLLVSNAFSTKIQEQHLKTVILSSQNQPIKKRIDNRNPVLEFVQYHRNNIFRP